MDICRNAREKNGSESVEVKYEDLVADPVNELARLYAWLGLAGGSYDDAGGDGDGYHGDVDVDVDGAALLAARTSLEQEQDGIRSDTNRKYIASFCAWLRGGQPSVRKEWSRIRSEFGDEVKKFGYSLDAWEGECTLA